ncbi:hypothetical protein Gotur_007119 [Gossypium turneri]
MGHWVSIYIALGAIITLDLSDEALGAKLVCWLDPCIRLSLSHVNRGN